MHFAKPHSSKKLVILHLQNGAFFFTLPESFFAIISRSTGQISCFFWRSNQQSWTGPSSQKFLQNIFIGETFFLTLPPQECGFCGNFTQNGMFFRSVARTRR